MRTHLADIALVEKRPVRKYLVTVTPKRTYRQLSRSSVIEWTGISAGDIKKSFKRAMPGMRIEEIVNAA